MKADSVFRCKHFDIHQNNLVFKVGTDAVLLAYLVQKENTIKSILEIGTGTGVISLVLAQRFKDIQITAIDIDKNAYELSKLNFSNSSFNSQLKSIHTSIQDLDKNKKFDLIVCNPPYFEPNEKYIHKKHNTARSQTHLDYESLISNIKSHLNPKGKSVIIFPTENFGLIEETILKNNLYISKKWNIYGIKNGKIKRNIIEFSPTQLPFSEEDFTIEETQRMYSKEYVELTQEFHFLKA
ncbi:MAG: methyltransferase [Flavobacteriales bacterium]|nr:methyltransferase [Flavobacteriales bacterium]